MFKEVNMRTAVNDVLDGKDAYMYVKKDNCANKGFYSLKLEYLCEVMRNDEARFIVDEESEEG